MSPKGYYSKYTVFRNDATGRPARRMDTAIFVLDRRDPSALAALVTYAEQTTNDELAWDIVNIVQHTLEDAMQSAEVKWGRCRQDRTALTIKIGRLKRLIQLRRDKKGREGGGSPRTEGEGQ